MKSLTVGFLPNKFFNLINSFNNSSLDINFDIFIFVVNILYINKNRQAKPKTNHYNKRRKNNMLTYEYICENAECLNEWEEEAEIVDPKQTTCPKCLQETAKRLISGGSGKGIVELSGQELLSYVQDETQKMRVKCNQNESYLANMVGENRYQSNVTSYESQRSIRRSK